MGTNMPEAIVTSEESRYRDKYYRGVISVKKRDLFCSSCGNRISYEADNYSSHPFLGTLQCQPCFDQFKFLKSTVKTKAWKKRCLMCGSDSCQTLFPCPVKSCPYSFCQKCIKRNASSALLLADTPKWKCYVCETNPLWEARGVCATLLSASPRRRKKQKLVQEISSDDDDIEDIMKVQKANSKKKRNSRISKPSTSERKTRNTRSVSKSSDHQATDDSDNEIEILSVSKTKKKSQKSSTRRRISSDRSSASRSISPELSEHSSKTANTQKSKRLLTSSSSSSSELKKSMKHPSLSLKRENSDSSSSKEFTQTKLIKDGYVPLQRLSIRKEDYTHSPFMENYENKNLTKQQTFSLKNHVNEFLKELRATSKKMSDAADLLQRHYSVKETINSFDATKLIAECKNTTYSLRQNIDHNEKKLINKFGDWCNKSKIKNIFINLTNIDDSTPTRCGLTSKSNTAKGVIPQSSSDEEKEDDNNDKSEFSRNSNGSLNKTPEVSDCESDEIFTQIKNSSSKPQKSNVTNSRLEETKALSPVNEDLDDECGIGNIDPELPPSPVSAVSVASNNSLQKINQEVCNKNDLNESSNDIFADECNEENEEVPGNNVTSHLSDSSNMSEEQAPLAPKIDGKNQEKEDETKISDTKILTDRKTKKNRTSRESSLETNDIKKSRRKSRSKSDKLDEDNPPTTGHSKNEKTTKSPLNFSSCEENDTPELRNVREEKSGKGNKKKLSSLVVGDSRKVTDKSESLEELISAFSEEEGKATHSLLTTDSSETEKTEEIKTFKKKKKKQTKNEKEKMEPQSLTFSDQEKKAKETLLNSDTSEEEAEDVGSEALLGKSREKKHSSPIIPESILKRAQSKSDSSSNEAECIQRDKAKKKSKKIDSSDAEDKAKAFLLKSGSSLDEAENIQPDESSKKTLAKSDTQVNGKKLLLESNSLSDEAEELHPTESSKKKERIYSSDEEEEAKKSLLKTDSSSDEAEEYNAQTSVKSGSSLAEEEDIGPDESSKKSEKIDLLVDAQNKAEDALLQSKTSVDENESVESEKSEEEQNSCLEGRTKKTVNHSKKVEKISPTEKSSKEDEEEAKKSLLKTDSSSDEYEGMQTDKLAEKSMETDLSLKQSNTKKPLKSGPLSASSDESSQKSNKIDSFVDAQYEAREASLISESSGDENESVESKQLKKKQQSCSEARERKMLDDSEKVEQVSNAGKFPKDDEENAKRTLLASDSSSDESKQESQSSKNCEKVEKLVTNNNKTSQLNSSDVEEKTKNDLLNSDTSLNKSNELAINKSADRSMITDTSKKIFGRQKNVKGSSSNSSSSDESKNKTLKKSESKINITEKSLKSLSDSDNIFTSPKVKRRKLHLKSNEYYKSDKKLRLRCTVMVERLSNRILRRYAKALKKSKEYLEDKELKSLTSLRRLEKTRKRDCGDVSDSDGTSTSRHKKKSSKKTEEDTLMDHLNVNNGEKVDTDDASSDDDTSQKIKKSHKSGDLVGEAEEVAKNALLETSDEEKIQEISSDDEQQSDKDKKKKSNKERKSKGKSADGEKSEKSEWKRSKLLTMKLSSSDEEGQSKKIEKKVMKLSQKTSDDSDNEDGCGGYGKKKKRTRRRRLNSDSDIKLTDEDSQSADNDNHNNSDNDKKIETGKKGKKRVKKVENSSDSSSTTMSKSRPKPKRRRVRTANTDSDSDIEELNNSQGSPNKSGRKNIRKVMRDKQVADDTKEAAKQEEERLKRMAERQKLYNELYEARLAGEKKVDKLILDFDEESKEELLSVNEGLVKRLKPHQAQGIKFMWDACFESLERAKSTKGSGCILAHCMGLGKSFQVVTLTHTLLSNDETTGVKTVLVVCPLSTVLNWVNEFNIWLNEVNDGDDVEVYELTKFKKNFERKYQLERWQKTGGVLIMGYEMYRNLSNPTKKLSKKLKESFFKCLVEPGPDLVVCDEGHLLKSEATAISKAMSKIRTLRRIVLTGTPLQNNLTEYHCMVQFVKPNLLGTRKEFLNRFVNPIQNGQFDDSTEYDVKLMKKRAHVLHKMLEGSVQRFDYSVLTPFLPPKQEYVIFIKLTDVQVKLYQYYIDNLARKHRGAGGSLFADFQALQRVWTHPIAIKLNADKTAERKLREESDSEGSLKDFIDDDSSSDSSSKSDNSVASTNSSKSKKSEAGIKRGTRANPVADAVEEPTVEEQLPQDNFEWWKQFVEDEHFEDLRISSKLRILFEILKECENIGDKVLVFSQSLYSLTLIERFLAMIDDETQRGNTSDFIDGHTGSWSLGLDYFRLDGQTSTENRSQWCKVFNRPTNTRARLFLISTRAGGLGINLTAANRVVIFDASWNPSHDVQSIFRIYRFGQKKPCYVYRLLAAGTMEEKIYNRQVTKLSLSCRVVDEQQIERHYTNSDLAELYTFDKPDDNAETIGCPKDRLLAEIFSKHKGIVRNFHEHDSLLENKAEEELDEEERKQAWLEYEQEKAGRPPVNPMAMMNYQDQIMMQQFNQQLLNSFPHNGSTMQNELDNLQRFYQKDFPNMTPEQQKMMATKALMDMYSYVENQAIMSNRITNPMASNQAYPNPTNTLANQLAQQAYTRHHQQVKQMTAAQKQIQYAQQFGNFKTLPGIISQNAGARQTVPVPQTIPIITDDPDIIEITPSTTTSSNTAQPSTAQGKPAKYQEE